MKAIYPGTFDPFTNGHFDILLRGAKLFDEVIVAVAKNSSKSPFLSLEERCEMIQKCIQSHQKISVKPFDILLVDFAREEGAKVVIRGLRAVSDFEYELQMAYTNQSLDSELETLYLMPTLKNAFVSSSMVRNVVEYGGKISHFVPQEVVKFLQKKGIKCI